MALITTAAVAAMHTSLSLQYQSGYDATRVFWQDIATQIPSSTTSNTYSWMQQLDQMRQWVGPRVIRDMANSSFTLTNLPFELTLGVDRHDWEDENTGTYGPRAASMGQAAAKLPDQRLALAIAAGQTIPGTGTSYDGVSFFNLNHTINPAGVQSNVNALGLTAANYETARAAMMSLTGETGQSLGVTPNLLVVNPSLEGIGKRILEADIIADAVVATAGTTNVNKGTAKLLVVPELSVISATCWFLLDTTKPIKPFIWQLRQAPVFAQMTDPSDFVSFMLRQFIWGVEARGAAGYGPWWLAYQGNV